MENKPGLISSKKVKLVLTTGGHSAKCLCVCVCVLELHIIITAYYHSVSELLVIIKTQLKPL